LEKNKIDALQSELSLLKTQFTDRINSLEHKLYELSASTVQEENQLTTSPLDESVTMAANARSQPLIIPEKQA